MGKRAFRSTAWMLGLSLALLPVSAFATAANAGGASTSNMAALRQLLNQPEGSIDLARAKVTIDHMVDPKVDIEGTLRLLDQWAAKARARFPRDASNKAKLELLISTLQKPGPWNNNRPFDYDYADPLGKDIKNTLLSTYLAKRKGQCVIMPIAFALLAQKLGLPVAMTTAPYHVLVKYGDEEKGQWMNVEATSGRIYYDSNYEQSLDIPPEAIKQGPFLRPYTHRETVALFATSTLAPFYKDKRQPERMLEVTDLILKANPKDVIAMTIRGDAYYLLIEQQFKSKYPLAEQIPQAKRAEYLSYSRKNLEWYSKAEALGWREWTKAQWDNYIKHSANMKSKNQQQGGK